MKFTNALVVKLTDITNIKFMPFLSVSSSLVKDIHS